jgi:hypothetical protein
VTDDRRVGEQEDGLGDEGREGGPGQPEDLAVLRMMEAAGRDPRSRTGS